MTHPFEPETQDDFCFCRECAPRREMAVEAKVPLVAVLGTGSLLTVAWAPEKPGLDDIARL